MFFFLWFFVFVFFLFLFFNVTNGFSPSSSSCYLCSFNQSSVLHLGHFPCPNMIVSHWVKLPNISNLIHTGARVATSLKHYFNSTIAIAKLIIYNTYFSLSIYNFYATIKWQTSPSCLLKMKHTCLKAKSNAMLKQILCINMKSVRQIPWRESQLLGVVNSQFQCVLHAFYES